jgi:hypothetical protein
MIMDALTWPGAEGAAAADGAVRPGHLMIMARNSRMAAGTGHDHGVRWRLENSSAEMA